LFITTIIVSNVAGAASASQHESPSIQGTAVWKRPTDVSASVIATARPELYDVFAHVCGAETYVPCLRIQNMMDWTCSEHDITSFQAKIETSLSFADTYRKTQGGSESNVTDLNLQAMLRVMAEFSKEVLRCGTTNFEKEATYLAKPSGPKRGLYLLNRAEQPVIFGAETKGAESSLRMCFPQLIAICGSGCIELHRLGVPREDCAVLGIAVTESSCQFCAVYLLRDNLPVMVAVSPVLTLVGTRQEQYCVATWCLRFVRFGTDMSSLSYGSAHMPPSDVVVRLRISGYFAKPIRCRNETQHLGTARLYSNKLIRLNHIMRMYETLRKTVDGAKSVVLFPEGVISVPGEDVDATMELRKMLIQGCERDGFRNIDLTYTPLILFPRLDTWTTHKPPPRLRDSYIEQLTRVHDALNQAQIAHLDEHPANILWRELAANDVAGVEIRLIDFEEAVYFNHVIPAQFVRAVLKSADWRYPFKCGDDEVEQLAGEKHNAFFLMALTRWVQSEVLKFGDFMGQEGPTILASLLGSCAR
jgi:hypothetical protein